MKLLAVKNGFSLVQVGKDFYKVVNKYGQSSVNEVGTKQELIDELTRWKHEVDMDNTFMLEVENSFINILYSL